MAGAGVAAAPAGAGVAEAAAPAWAGVPDTPTAASVEVGDVACGEPVAEERIRELIAASPRFARAWRHGLDRPGWSLSEWDLAVCGAAARAGSDDQELAGLIAAHRQQHDDPSGKASRVDYVARTVALARAERVLQLVRIGRQRVP